MLFHAGIKGLCDRDQIPDLFGTTLFQIKGGKQLIAGADVGMGADGKFQYGDGF